MAEDHGTPGAEEIEVAVAVRVEEISAFGMGDERRIATHGTKCPHGRVNSSREEAFGAELKLARVREGAGHTFSIGGRKAHHVKIGS
jgi:hypothetical protein